MSDVIAKIIHYTKDYESPTSYWQWSSYSLIAAIARYNVFLKHKIGKIYPNTYTVLLGDSGKYRKGAPLNLVNDLLNELSCTKMFTGTASIQGILDALSQDTAVRKKGITLKGGACLILAEELAGFFVEDPRLLPLLTRIYDFSEEFPYNLRGSNIVIKNLCVSMLAASNETFLREIYNQRATYGGLLRRTLLITPDEVRNPNSLLDSKIVIDEIKAKEQREEIIKDLREIQKLVGQMTVSDAAGEMYTDWYNTLYLNYDKFGSKAGIIEGIHTLVLKIAMIKALSKCSLQVEAIDVSEAIYEVTGLRKNYVAYAMASGQSDIVKIKTIVLTFLWKAKNYTATKREILFAHWNDMSEEELDSIINTFITAGLVAMTTLGGNNIAFTLTRTCIDQFEAKINKPKP